jgi:hypothetical protein
LAERAFALSTRISLVRKKPKDGALSLRRAKQGHSTERQAV